ncbi:MAG TPA: hypothetical protein VMR76_00875 [Candidatus Saccharimonadia bacterium]|nr:hypothetical protein [Candidatus Saccharimonadia bacterium]
MTTICPTITAVDEKTYNLQLDLVEKFAKRLHVDLADGLFASRLVNVKKIKKSSVRTDFHIMYENPGLVLDDVFKLKPSLIIVHFESDVNISKVLAYVKSQNIKFGIAILQHTPVSKIKFLLKDLDHVLVFSGHLGSFGGIADLNLLEKIKKIKSANTNLEIGWDGGINGSNIRQLVDAGVDVLNVGGYISRSDDPREAYNTLTGLVGKN